MECSSKGYTPFYYSIFTNITIVTYIKYILIFVATLVQFKK